MAAISAIFAPLVYTRGAECCNEEKQFFKIGYQGESQSDTIFQTGSSGSQKNYLADQKRSFARQRDGYHHCGACRHIFLFC